MTNAPYFGRLVSVAVFLITVGVEDLDSYSLAFGLDEKMVRTNYITWWDFFLEGARGGSKGSSKRFFLLRDVFLGEMGFGCKSWAPNCQKRGRQTFEMYSKCLKSEHSYFGAFQSCPIPKISDFRCSVDRLDQPNARISDVYSLTERPECPKSERLKS